MCSSVGALILYFFFELAYNHYIRELRGLDKIPNAFYWKNCCLVRRKGFS